MRKIASGWRKVVEEYSRLQLTKLPEDRLVALSGIASEYGRGIEAQQWELETRGRVAEEDDRLRYRYVCGSWFPELRDLVWEQATEAPGPRTRSKGMPTWSWASMGTKITTTSTKDGRSTTTELSTGLAVRWSNSYRTNADCALLDFVRVPVDPVSLEPRFDLADGRYAPENIYGNDGRFAALEVEGRLLRQRVTLHGLFATEDDRTAAANVTGHSPSFGRDAWRRVATVRDPGRVAGWASIEHPDFQPDAVTSCAQQQTAVCALVAAVSRKVQGGWLLGQFSPHLTAYEVLYLRRMQVPGFETQGGSSSSSSNREECYERIGVGRLFGDEVDEMYAVTEKSRVWLV